MKFFNLIGLFIFFYLIREEMSGSRDNKVLNVFDWLRIRFVGRPYEMNKLVVDKSTIIANRAESNRIVKGISVFYGIQYIGYSLSSVLVSLVVLLNRKPMKEKKARLLFCLFPMMSLTVYAHTSQNIWDILRPQVIECRKRDTKFFKGNKTNDFPLRDKSTQAEFKMLYNSSLDEHEYINSQLGFLTSIKEAILFIFRNDYQQAYL